MRDWIRHHKNIFIRQLPNGFSIDISVNIHESSKISITVSCSMLIGTLDFKKGLEIDHSKIDGKILEKMSKMLRSKKYI